MKTPESVSMKGRYRFTIRDAKTGGVKRVYEYENIIPTAGRTAIANHLSSSSPSVSSLCPNYAALGTGTNAPASGDTTLQTEATRQTVSGGSNTGATAFITAFFPAGTSGTYREAGLFMAGTSSANTGTLLSRVAINITKGSTETLTIDWTVTVS